MNQTEKIRQYVMNLSESGVRQGLFQLLKYPAVRFFMLNCVEEFHKAYNHPIKEDSK